MKLRIVCQSVYGAASCKALLTVAVASASLGVASAALRKRPSTQRSIAASTQPRHVTLRHAVGVAHNGEAATAAAPPSLLRPLSLANGTLHNFSRAATVDLFDAAGNAAALANASIQYPMSDTSDRPPRIYFLFLAVDKVSNLPVWKNFFAQAPPTQYRAFVHCKNPSCVLQVAGSPLQAVPTVPSYYCTDLVSPMNQLLAVALGSDVGSGNPLDKFTFISDSTLPAKPFPHVYSILSSRQGSDFCVFPSAEWADIPGSAGLEIAVKHHQWLTLDRDHALRASTLWTQGKRHDFMSRYHMNAAGWTYGDNSFADGRNFGCLDEFWFMLALFGPFAHSSVSSEQTVHLSMFTGSPVYISGAPEWQGACDTFVLWSQYLHAAGNSAFDRLYSSLDAASVPNSGNSARPGWWDHISSAGIASIRASEFLFVRKFVDQPTLTDAGSSQSFLTVYSRIILDI
eukprot:TRINITY_DN40035_c0_g1_i1.p1 TRINITY_DN40035_c0_g1~~TRINITY_DN40035_c0_g1_i1.p1  ORF type:complete len:457 (+),score=58.05 TRINITY_DN40035_c0_g1_i1:28-1398(+)